MALKKPSQAAKAVVDGDAADRLADQLADKPYGSEILNQVRSAPVTKARSLSISLPPSVIDQLEDQVRENKRSGEGAKTISGILREMLEAKGYRGAVNRNN